MLDVIAMGSATVDVFLDLEPRSQPDKRRIVLARGGKMLVKELHLATGGGGTNVAVGLSRLGYRVAFLGKVGSKNNAQRVLAELRSERVRAHLIHTGRGRTGYSMILNCDQGDRSILTYKGSNDDLRWQDIPMHKVRARWLYATSMMGKSWEALKRVAAHCAKRRMRICFNPSSYQAKRGARFLRPVLQYTAVLILNRGEAGLLVGDGAGSLPDQLRFLHKQGPAVVCITDGKRGVYVSDSQQYFWVPVSRKVRVVENTGAGDAFGAGFLAGFAARYDLVSAAHMGMWNAESVIKQYGAKAGLLTWRKVKGKWKKEWPFKIVGRPL